ncbi:MAG: TolC family protein [Candidatus Bipolaricaulota bacterium]
MRATLPSVRTLLAIGAVLCAGVFVCIVGVADGSESSTLTLVEAIRIGLEQAPTLRQAEIELEIARLELNAEFSTLLVPTVNLNLSPPGLTTAGWSAPFSGTLSAEVSLPLGTSSQLSGKLDVGWDPTTGSWSADGLNLSYSQRLSLAQSSTATDSIDKRRQNVADAESALGRVQAELVVDVAESFSQLLATAEALQKAELALAVAAQNLRQAKVDAEAGLVGETVVIQARISLLDAEISVDDRAVQLQDSQEEFFSQTLGLPAVVELVPPGFAFEAMVEAAGALVADEEAVAVAVASSSVVANAKEDLVGAQATLSKTRLGIDPDMTVQAGLSDKGFTLSWSVSLTLFSPTWSEEADIARLEVELAEVRLHNAISQATSSIRNSRADLDTAIRVLDRLPLEKERWALEEQMMRSKLESGLISQDDWDDFLEQLGGFQLDANERAVALFVALLEYRSFLGFPLEWEGWLE